MSAINCLLKKASDGAVDPARAEELSKRYLELEKVAMRKYGPNNGPAVAAKQLLEELEGGVSARRQEMLNIAEAHSRLTSIAAKYPGQVDLAGRAHLRPDPAYRFDHKVNVDSLGVVIENDAFADGAAVINAFRSKFAGVKQVDPAKLKAAGRVAFGEAAPDPTSQALGDAMVTTMRRLLNEANLAGMRIHDLKEKFGLPMRYGSTKMALVDRERFISQTRGRMESLVDDKTGRPASEERTEELLSEMYDEIITHGMSDVNAPRGKGKSGILQRRQAHRMVQYKDFDAWQAQLDEFGDGNVFSVFTNHVKSFARDIALVRVLGPDPPSSIALLKRLESADRAAAVGRAKTPREVKKAQRGLRGNKAHRALDNLFANLTHSNMAPDKVWMANLGAVSRSLKISAQLGSSFWLALNDLTYGAALAGFANGVPANRILTGYLRLLKNENKMVAMQAQLGAQGFASLATGAERFAGDLIESDWAKVISDFTLRATWLSPLTDIGRWNFGTEFMVKATQDRSRKYGELDRLFRASLTRHGISEADWDIMREVPLWSAENGAELMRPREIVEAGHYDIGTKYAILMKEEVDFAVPTSSLSSRSFLLGQSQAGSVGGEARRFAITYKSFPSTVAFMQFMRVFKDPTFSPRDRMKYSANLVIWGSVMGMFTYQMQQLVAGKTLAPMDPTTKEGRKAWGEGAVRFGAGGLYVDVLADTLAGGGRRALNRLPGPFFDNASDVLDFGYQLSRAAAGERGAGSAAGRKMARVVKSFLPGKSAWWGKLALDRVLVDEIDKMIDPRQRARWRRQERRLLREDGQRYWSRPGDNPLR